jgi:RNA-directed DNA polymerase
MPARTKKHWFRPRSYAHFDTPIDKAAAEILVADKARVVEHGFHPLVLIPQRAVKRERLANGETHFSKKIRPIGYVAHSDAAIQSYYSRLLRDQLESRYESSCVGESVLAYRALDGRCNIHFASEAFEQIRRFEQCDVVALDVKGFFDSLLPSYLKARWKDLLGTHELPLDHYAVFKSVVKDTAITRNTLRDVLGPNVPRRRGSTNQKICDYEQFRSRVAPRLLPRFQVVATAKGDPVGNRRGIAQGTPISATLANLYMFEMDEQFQRLAMACGGIYRRYSDDLLFVVPRGYGRDVEANTVSMIQTAGLEIQSAKTERLIFDRNGASQICNQVSASGEVVGPSRLDYLGFSFDGQGTTIRDSTICYWNQKIQRIVNRAFYAASKQGETKIKRREIYAKFSKRGWGSVYGCWNDRDDPPSEVPRMALGRYLKLADLVLDSESIRRQSRQLENRLHRMIQRVESKLS